MKQQQKQGESVDVKDANSICTTNEQRCDKSPMIGKASLHRKVCLSCKRKTDNKPANIRKLNSVSKVTNSGNSYGELLCFGKEKRAFRTGIPKTSFNMDMTLS